MSINLKYEKTSRQSCSVYTGKNQCLGEIRRKRVGRYYHWCFFPAKFENVGDLWFTSRMLRQIHDKVKSLYKKRFITEEDL